jgi:hypothetical protein
MNCGCQFNLPSTHGYCQSAFVGTIVEGRFNDTPLSGLNWAALYKWPGEIKDGNGRRQIVIDERADEAQRIALETIISGEACEPLSNLFSVFASTCSEFCETLFLPIDLEADLERRTARVEIPGVMRSSGRPMINEFNGQPFHIALARPSGSFEFTYAEIGLGTTSVTGDKEMTFEFMGAVLCSPLQSGWLGPRKIKAHRMAWQHEATFPRMTVTGVGTNQLQLPVAKNPGLSAGVLLCRRAVGF